jgi:hypothetical protein
MAQSVQKAPQAAMKVCDATLTEVTTTPETSSNVIVNGDRSLNGFGIG